MNKSMPGRKSYAVNGKRYDYPRPLLERPLRTLGGAYLQSRAFKELAPETQVQFRKAIRWLSPRVHTPISEIDHAQILRFQDAAIRDGRHLAHAIAAALSAALLWNAERLREADQSRYAAGEMPPSPKSSK
jgi:hypothetical protein